jgi:hypothetical protein
MTPKVFIFLKRRAGMNVADFRDHYETRHRPLMDKYLSGLSFYARNYLNPLPHIDTKTLSEPEFDVVTELHFEDRKAFEGLVAMVSKGKLPPEIAADEDLFLDRAATRYCWVEASEG